MEIGIISGWMGHLVRCLPIFEVSELWKWCESNRFSCFHDHATHQFTLLAWVECCWSPLGILTQRLATSLFLLHTCVFFLSKCLLIDLIFNYTSMDHLFMINGKHNFTHFYWEILGDHYLLQGGGDSRGMKWFSRGYKGGSFVINQEWSLSRSHHPCISVVDFLLLIESICFFRCRRMYYQYPQLWRQCWLQQYRRLF